MPKLPLDIEKVVRDFDTYSDDQIIADPAAAQIIGISLASLLRNNPVPRIDLSQRRKGRRVGDIRNLVRGTPKSAA